jgi:hypothetical protein
MYRIRYEDETFAFWIEPSGVKISLWEETGPVFVCGKLMDPKFHSTIIGREAAMAPVVALKCQRDVEDVVGKAYTFLIKKGQGFVPGMALLGITKDEQQRLDEFEEIGSMRKVEEIVLLIGNREVKGISFFKK